VQEYGGMAGSSLLTLIDDIATLLDDVSILTKVAAKKTAGVLGDDLALNAQQVSGVNADRELPVVWAVAKGSALNKVILVPVALLLSAFLPWAVTPLLMLGGLYLCYEGFEKVAHKVLHTKAEDAEHHRELVEATSNEQVDMVAFEKSKIKGAIRTDFILSAEIIVISLGSVAGAVFFTQLSVLVAIAIIMTIGVYGLVAGIVRLDDLGVHLMQTPDASRGASFKQGLGRVILSSAPILMKALAIVGTVAMFLVGGAIIAHGLPVLADWIHHLEAGFSPVMSAFMPTLINGATGIIAGGLAVLVAVPVRGLWSRVAPSA